MHAPAPPRSMEPLGDQACLVRCASEEEARAFASSARQMNWPWLVDVVPAYTTVGLYFDLRRCRYPEVEAALQRLTVRSSAIQHREIEIPCCYAYQEDLKRIASHSKLDPERVIELHWQTTYTVYAIGFCPGFPYMGYLPEPLAGVPRLPSPRPRVEPGFVGLTGRQTGIYTEKRPGGWNLIGRTPLELVNVQDGYFPLQVGDRVRFTPISRAEFQRLRGKRL
jgi:inhibitor of KinA